MANLIDQTVPGGDNISQGFAKTNTAISELNSHVGDTTNPHGVTTTQIGAETPAGAQAKVDTHGALAAPHTGHAAKAGNSSQSFSVAAPTADIHAVPYSQYKLSRYNSIINGDCRIAQGQIKTLSEADGKWIIGSVDRFGIIVVNGIGVLSGNIRHAIAAPIGRTGKALLLNDATVGDESGGGAYLMARTLLEATDSIAYKNRQASVGVWVLHNKGSSIDYSIQLRKAGAVDDFVNKQTIVDGPTVSVPTNTPVFLKLENIAMGDCSNGIEIRVRANAGIFSNKSFYFTDFSLQFGPRVTDFEIRAKAEELMLVRRYRRKSYPTDTPPGSATNEGAFFALLGTSGAAFIRSRGSVEFDPPMRATPAMRYWDSAGNQNKITVEGNSNISPAIGSPIARASQSGFVSNFDINASNEGAHVEYHWEADAELGPNTGL